MVLTDSDVEAKRPFVSSVRAEQAYELCVEASGKRDCFLLGRDDAGPACGSLSESVQGEVVARCTPPADCAAVTARFESIVRAATPVLDVQLVGHTEPVLRVAIPDVDSTPDEPLWNAVTIGRGEAPDAWRLAAELSAACR